VDIEYHYWITAMIAHRAGFTEAETQVIAYASEYVDENDVCYRIRNKKEGGEYRNFISQTMNILKPKHELMRIYPIFHFVPGEPDAETARRRDGKMHLLNTTPNNESVNVLIDSAFKSSSDTRLYRIGIATHTYVDTWAHQNFVGWYDVFNNIGLDLKPDIGHADGEHHPDWVSHVWEDSRLVDSAVNNRHRFLSASKALFEKYCGYLKAEKGIDNSSQWSQLEADLMTVMGFSYSGNQIRYEKQRLQSYQKHVPFLDGFDERIWFDAAIETDTRGLPDSTDGILASLTLFEDRHYWRDAADKESTHWFGFQEAVKEHERLAIKQLTPTFLKMGIDLAVV